MLDIGSALTRALGPRESPPAAAAVAPAPAPAGDVAASPGAMAVTYLLLAAGLLLAILVDGNETAFTPRQGLVLFTGFYVAAQAVERLLELVLPPGGGTAQAKADRALIVGGLAFLLGVGLSLKLGLYFLSAVQVGDAPRLLDVVVTGLVIAGGTKPLHDLIATIEKSKTGA